MLCTHALCRTEKSDVIIVDDEDSPINAQRQLGAGAGNSAQSAADLHALKELLDQEEKKLNLLKSKRVHQTSPSELDILTVHVNVAMDSHHSSSLGVDKGLFVSIKQCLRKGVLGTWFSMRIQDCLS